MNAKWFSIFMLVAVGILLLYASSCGDPQELVSISVQPGTETFGASDIPVPDDAGLQVQLRALGSYVHPPVTKDITNQVTWTSNDTQMVTVSSTGLATANGDACGGTLISATVTTNADGSGVSSSGAIVTGYMTANVVCFTSSGSTGLGPTVTVQFLGAGAGTITSQPPGLNCATTAPPCVGTFASGTTVTLTAIPIGTFGGWGGSCTSEVGETCTIDNLTADVNVTATFN
jgi:Bacterial Ig-like domain (group 2)